MKQILIVYSTKYGTSKLIAEYIKLKLEGAVICDVANATRQKIEQSDVVILGASIYFNSVRADMAKLIIKESKALSKKALALYVCSGVADQSLQAEQPCNVFGRRLCARSLVHICAGYRYEFDKMDQKDKQFLKAIPRLSEDREEIYTQEIDKLIEVVQQYVHRSDER